MFRVFVTSWLHFRADIRHEAIRTRSCWCVDVMTSTRIALGKTGEDLACRELERLGYAIVARRYRRRSGELDIIARHGMTTVFVEVKARSSCAFGEAVEAVGALKQRRIVQLAREYVVRHRLTESPCRFDVVSIDFRGGHPSVEVFQNAFDASS
jgi:putative endonuclease